ncbi:MAG: chemotaxis protein CheW [Desulfonauticus sp.]|nr:chemotaxis protein CheW [Desulfonauticus sp.]
MEETVQKRKGPFQASCFYLGEALCGIDINLVQEINKQIVYTAVPHAPDYVLGIMNLRGRIVTIVDFGKKLGLGCTKITDSTRIIIVNSKEEQIGLMVDRITDVVNGRWEDIAPPPANIKGIQGRFFLGVCKVKNRLVALLNVEEALADELVKA